VRNGSNQLPPALDALTELQRWVVWRYEQKRGSDKPTKVPYQALHPN
jgi:primase-polymerase (primpol)-like protein